LTSELLNRRTALSKAAKVAIGAGAVVVIGGGAAAYLAMQPPTAPQQVTTTTTAAASTTSVIQEVDVDIAHITYPYFQDALKTAVPELQTKHPELNIKATDSVQDYSSYRQYLITRMAAGDAPDLMLTDDIWMGEFTQTGFLEPLPDAWATAQGPVPDLLPNYKEGSTFNGKLYGIWWDTDTRLFPYLKKYISSPPTTWDDTIALQKQLKAQGKPPIAFYAAYGWDDTVNSAMYMNIPVDQLKAPGWGFFDVSPDGTWTPIFNKDPGVKAFQYLLDLKNAGGAAILDKPEEVDAAFLNGTYSAELAGGTWIYSEAVGSGWTADRYQSELGYAVQPIPPGGHTASYGGGFVLTIPAGSKHKSLMEELILLLVDPDLEAQLGGKYGALFTRESVLQKLIANKAFPFADVVAQQMQFTIPRPMIPQWDRVHRYWIDALQSTLLGKQTPKQALDDAAAKVAILLGD
jgi:multiple sugar transport system substrate-binding protein